MIALLSRCRSRRLPARTKVRATPLDLIPGKIRSGLPIERTFGPASAHIDLASKVLDCPAPRVTEHPIASAHRGHRTSPALTPAVLSVLTKFGRRQSARFRAAPAHTETECRAHAAAGSLLAQHYCTASKGSAQGELSLKLRCAACRKGKHVAPVKTLDVDFLRCIPTTYDLRSGFGT